MHVRESRCSMTETAETERLKWKNETSDEDELHHLQRTQHTYIGYATFACVHVFGCHAMRFPLC